MSSFIAPEVKTPTLGSSEAVIDYLRLHLLSVCEERAWLLVHAVFAVNFGALSLTEIMTATPSDQALHPDYLQEVRLFGSKGELHLWKYRGQFYARLLTDENIAKDDYIQESQILWGAHAEPGPMPGWSTIIDNQGPTFAVPHEIRQQNHQERMRLRVRHYLAVEAETHLMIIADSRLVALCDHSDNVLTLSAF